MCAQSSKRILASVKVCSSSVYGIPSEHLVLAHYGLRSSLKFTIRVKLYSGVQHSLQECKGVWWMPRLQEAMKDVIWLR
jgi:hypothetical protein